MPLLILLLLIVLVAQIGFWDTLSAILGAIGVLILIALVAGALLALSAYYVLSRLRKRF